MSEHVVQLPDGSFQAPGTSATYRIILPKPSAFGFVGRDKASCSCPASLGGNECTHITAVQFYLERQARKKAS